MRPWPLPRGEQGLDRLARLLARRKAGSAVAAVRREPRKRRLVFALDQNEAFASAASIRRRRRTAAQHDQRHRVAAHELVCPAECHARRGRRIGVQILPMSLARLQKPRGSGVADCYFGMTAAG